MESPQLEPQDSSPNCFQSPNHAAQTSQKLERYLKEKRLCDVVLVAGDRRISAHRLMLSAVSDYFEAMFTSNLRESVEYEVTLEKVDPDALSSLVQYVYTGHLQICENNVESLMDVACLLQLQPVVEACSGNLVKYLQPSNCLGIRNFADAHDCLELFTVAHNYTMECLTKRICQVCLYFRRFVRCTAGNRSKSGEKRTFENKDRTFAQMANDVPRDAWTDEQAMKQIICNVYFTGD